MIGGPFSIELLTLSSIRQKHETINDNARERAADLTRAEHLALVGYVATLATFIKRCGNRDARHGRISEADAQDMDEALRPTAMTFVYTRRGTTTDVIFIHDRASPMGVNQLHC